MKQLTPLLLIFCSPVFAASQDVIDALPTISKIQQASKSHFYIQGHYAYNKLEIDDEFTGVPNINSHGFGVALGYQVNPWIAYQGYTQLFLESDVNVVGEKVNAQLDPTLGLQLKLSTDTTKDFSGFVKAGYELSGIKSDIGDSSSENFFTASVGAAYAFTPKLYLEVEYMYATGFKLEIYKDSGLISIGYRFD